MKHNNFKTLLFALPMVLSPLTTSCQQKNYSFDHTDLFGMCEVSYELSSAVDRGLTNAWIAERAAAMKCKSFRQLRQPSCRRSLSKGQSAVWI